MAKERYNARFEIEVSDAKENQKKTNGEETSLQSKNKNKFYMAVAI